MSLVFNPYLQLGETTLGQIGQGAYAVIYSIQRPNGSTVARKIAEDEKGIKAIEKELKVLTAPGAKSYPIVKFMVRLYLYFILFFFTIEGLQQIFMLILAGKRSITQSAVLVRHGVLCERLFMANNLHSGNKDWTNTNALLVYRAPRCTRVSPRFDSSGALWCKAGKHSHYGRE